MTKISFGGVDVGGFLPAFESIRHFLIDTCFDSGNVSIPVCFFNSLKNSCCNENNFLLSKFEKPSRIWLPNCVKLLLSNSDTIGYIVYEVRELDVNAFCFF